MVVADVEQSAIDRAIAELGTGDASLIGIQTDVSNPYSVNALAIKSMLIMAAVIYYSTMPVLLPLHAMFGKPRLTIGNGSMVLM